MLNEHTVLRETRVMEAFIVEINAWAWGVPMQVLLLGTGIFLTLGLGFLTWRRLGFAFRLLLGGF
jgi:AGCS family alanine or glycine:cation symporter